MSDDLFDVEGVSDVVGVSVKVDLPLLLFKQLDTNRVLLARGDVDGFSRGVELLKSYLSPYFDGDRKFSEELEALDKVLKLKERNAEVRFEKDRGSLIEALLRARYSHSLELQGLLFSFMMSSGFLPKFDRKGGDE